MQTTETTLSLPRSLVNKMLAHAQGNPTTEICGLIGSNPSGTKEYYSINNVADNPHNRFLMDTPQQIQTMKIIREKQQEFFAIVHSHPTANAQPSQLDIKENNYKNVFYIIISLNTKGVLEMRAYSYHQNNLSEIALVLED